MKELTKKLNDILGLYEDLKGIRFDEDVYPSLPLVIERLIREGTSIPYEAIVEVSHAIAEYKARKHYLGDPKWVLYQYICDSQPTLPYPTKIGGIISHGISGIRCGSYAFTKISRFSEFKDIEVVKGIENSGFLNLNGDRVWVVSHDYFDKKQVVISPWTNFELMDTLSYMCGKGECHRDGGTIFRTIYPDDIVLYFA